MYVKNKVGAAGNKRGKAHWEEFIAQAQDKTKLVVLCSGETFIGVSWGAKMNFDQCYQVVLHQLFVEL